MGLPLVLFGILIGCPLITGKRHVVATYEEIIALNASCDPLDSCRNHTGDDGLDIRNCNCGKFCRDLGTCCIDSPYRSFNTYPINRLNKCSTVYGTNNYRVFMISECKPSWRGEPAVALQCAGDGELLNDPLLTIPVTSERTGLTYKNFFCYKCNEDRYQILPTFWHVILEGDEQFLNSSSPANSWPINDASEKSEKRISFDIFAPDNIWDHIKVCRGGVISECALNWTDNVIRSKCSSYMGLIRIPIDRKIVFYRNAHCALCNYESFKHMICYDFHFEPHHASKSFSFSLLVDVNQLDGDIVGKVNRCGNDSVYDPYFKKCRILKCAFPGYSIVNGHCVQM